MRTLADLGTEKSRIRTIIESLPNGVLVTNTLGQVVLMNPACFHHLEVPLDHGTGDVIGAYIAEKELCDIVLDISAGKYAPDDDIPTYEFAMSDDKFLMARGRPVLNSRNECLGAVINFMDITAIKLLDRLKSEFVAKVSHELRSPLSTIHEQLAVVLRDVAEEESIKDHEILSRAKEKTQNLIALIGDMLDLSRIEAGNVGYETKQVQLEELLESIVVFMSDKTKSRNQTLTFNKPDTDLPHVVADPMALESIFGNLITNAINYTPDGGKITVTVKRVKMGIKTIVSDTGFGIEEKHLESIFERFYRVKDDNTRLITGTGLGLPIVKGLVERLKGSIEVESQEGKGTSFTVFLPTESD
jgi:signal transduction histidine kinase